MSYIFYNNSSSEDLDIIIENTPIIPTTNNIYQTITIDGGENLTTIKGFSDIEMNFDFWYKATDDEYFMKKAGIDNWLLSATSKDLFYSIDESKIYRVKQIKISETKTSSKIIRHFTTSFICVGLKYMKGGMKVQPITTSGSVLNNSGTYEAKPLIKIYGSGNITININGKTFTVNNVSSYVVVDSEIKECYKDTTNKGKDMTGDYPILPIGKNTISWSGTVSKIEIIPRWRCY